MNERRYDPTTGEWVMYATHRQDRTFLPLAENCPLCPTTTLGPATEIPRDAFDVAVFDNRFPSMRLDAEPTQLCTDGFFRTEPGYGACEVVVYTDQHAATLAELSPQRVRLLVDVWADRYARWREVEGIAYVLVFENRGEAIGVTLQHPHGQVYAYPDIPPRVGRKLAAAERYHAVTGRCVHCDAASAEADDGRRVVAQTEDWLVVVPFWARLPYETVVLPRRHVRSLPELEDAERDGLADVLRRLVRGYDRLWGFQLPYILGVHQEPTAPGPWAPFTHLHIELAPPHRTANKLKHLAGSEWMAGAFINDTVPEHTAPRLRAALGDAL